jgi:hypothetical protein
MACLAGGRKPAQIVMFRDGVGEGMFEQLFRIEMGAMIRACESLEKGYRPKVIRRCSRMYERSFASRFLSKGQTSGTCVYIQAIHDMDRLHRYADYVRDCPKAAPLPAVPD